MSELGVSVMLSPQTSPTTAFSRDLLGRFICNGFDEAKASARTRPHDCVVIGGGSFGLGYARSRRWLICPTCKRSVIFDEKRGTRN